MYSKIYSYILNNKFYHSTVDLNTFIVVIFIGKIHENILYQPQNKKNHKKSRHVNCPWVSDFAPKFAPEEKFCPSRKKK